MYDDIFIFVKLAEAGSFSLAAEILQISQASISRKLNNLEKTLKIQLITRNTHKFELTPDGQNLYAEFAPVAQEYTSSINEFIQPGNSFCGVLRVASPHLIINFMLAPLLGEFIDQLPHAKLIFTPTTQQVNLLKDGFDLALSNKLPVQGIAKVKLLRVLHSKLYATPAYISRFGSPASLAELCRHNWVGRASNNLAEANYLVQNLVTGYQQIIEYHPKILLNNAFQALRMAYSNSVIVLAIDVTVQDEIARGELVPILPNYSFSQQPLYLIQKSAPGALEQKFVDFILRNIPLISSADISEVSWPS